MNDRFKFRVYAPIQEVYADVESIDYIKGLVTTVCGETFKIEDVKFLQSTGLKDKNGKLIYEGDILQQPQLPHKVVCEWYKDGFWLNVFMNGAKRELRNMHNWYEVIGNIYENKELLESEG